MIREYYHSTLETVAEPLPTGWTAGHITLRLIHPEDRVAVEAWRRDAWGVHPVAKGHAVITHAPTGCSIWTARSMIEGTQIVDRIMPLADWGAIDTPKSMPELRDKTRAIIAEVERTAVNQ